MYKNYWCDILASTSERSKSYTFVAAVGLAVYQFIFLLVAVFTQLMLNADGAYFIFALGAGDPWELKWADLPTRLSTYIFTVIPTEILVSLFAVSGEGIAAVNGAVFYGFQLVQFVIVIALARPRWTKFLIFPIVQYAFSSLLGLGFPSEALLEPGFFWICMFCFARKRLPRTLFAVSFLGLIFSHEIALFGVIVVFASLLARRELMARNDYRWALVSAICATVAWLIVRLSGFHAADHYSIHVLDPRRVLNNPTLWLIVVVCLSIAGWVAVVAREASRREHVLIAALGVMLPLLLAPWFNFGLGRYETGRTLVGLLVPVLGIAMLAAVHGQNQLPKFQGGSWLSLWLPIAVTAVIALNIGGTLAFVGDWSRARSALEAYVGRGRIGAAPEMVTLHDASRELGPSSANEISRTGFSWTWPYRSVMLAPNYMPQRIIYDPEQPNCIAQLTAENAESIPPQVRLALTDVACRPSPARPPTISEHVLVFLRQLMASK